MYEWFEVGEERDENKNPILVTYRKFWKLQLLKWIVLPPMVVILWVVLIPYDLLKTFILGGWYDLKRKLSRFEHCRDFIKLIRWYVTPTKRIDKAVK